MYVFNLNRSFSFILLLLDCQELMNEQQGPVTILLSSKDKPEKSGTATSTPSATASGISTPLEGKKKNKGKGKLMTEYKVDQQLGEIKNADLLGTSISTQQEISAAEDKIDKLSVNENTSSR